TDAPVPSPRPWSPMRPVTYTHIDRLPASRDKVYALLTDPQRIGDWLPGCAAVEGTSIKRGARLTAHFGQRTTEFEVVDLNPGRTRPGCAGAFSPRARSSAR